MIVWYGDNLWYENYVGNRSYEYGIPFNYETQFPICSNTKRFTAVSILQLVEKGLIKNVTDNINDYLNATDLFSWGFPAGTTKWCPTIYNQSKTICEQNINQTFATLMSMQSGLLALDTCEYQPSQWQYEYCVPVIDTLTFTGSIADTIKILNPPNTPLWTAPSTYYNIVNTTDFSNTQNNNSYLYVNVNFIILSYMVEKISGMNLQAYYQQNIFDVVGLDNTVFDPFMGEFGILPNLANEYISYMDLPSSPSSSAPSGTYVPYEIGNCWHVEVDFGLKSGSGGIVSTLPDMVKWYTSLFLTKNTTVLTDASIDLLVFPWAISNESPQYYGFGVETMFASAIWKSPKTTTAPPPIMVFYMGGSQCAFFSVVMWNSSVNPFTGGTLATYPVVTAVARNNRMVNVSQDNLVASQTPKNMNWFTANMEVPFASWNGLFTNPEWFDGTCCPPYGASLTDTLYVAWNLLFTVASYPFCDIYGTITTPSLSPIALPTNAPSTATTNITLISKDLQGVMIAGFTCFGVVSAVLILILIQAKRNNVSILSIFNGTAFNNNLKNDKLGPTLAHRISLSDRSSSAMGQRTVVSEINQNPMTGYKVT